MIEPKFLYLKKTEKEKNEKGEVLEINSKWQNKEKKKEKVQHLTSFSKSRVWEGEIDSCKVTKEDKLIIILKYCNDVTVLSFLSMTMSCRSSHNHK